MSRDELAEFLASALRGTQRRLDVAQQRLDDARRDRASIVLRLHEACGLTYAEIAELTGFTRQRVGQLVAQARKTTPRGGLGSSEGSGR